MNGAIKYKKVRTPLDIMDIMDTGYYTGRSIQLYTANFKSIVSLCSWCLTSQKLPMMQWESQYIIFITNIIVVVPCNPDLKRENNKMVKRIFIFLTLNE